MSREEQWSQQSQGLLDTAQHKGRTTNLQEEKNKHPFEDSELREYFDQLNRQPSESTVPIHKTCMDYSSVLKGREVDPQRHKTSPSGYGLHHLSPNKFHTDAGHSHRMVLEGRAKWNQLSMNRQLVSESANHRFMKGLSEDLSHSHKYGWLGTHELIDTDRQPNLTHGYAVSHSSCRMIRDRQS